MDMANFFRERYKKLGYTGGFEPLAAKFIRINGLKADAQQVVDRLKATVQLKKTAIPLCYEVAGQEHALSTTSEYLLGYFYVQEFASQLPAAVLAPQPGERVLDMCSAPGSKTTQVAALMGNTGSIVALEPNFERAKKLMNNLERMGVVNCIVYQKDAKYADDLGMPFDKVLLDAPCSGNFSNDLEWFEKRTIEDVKQKAREQKKLIGAAIASLKPGGTLVYSTCSLEPEEDEDVVEFAMDEYGVELMEIDWKSIGIREEIGVPGSTERTRQCRRVWPSERNQGFFVASFRKMI